MLVLLIDSSYYYRDCKSLCEASNCYIINSHFYVAYFFVKKLLFIIKKKRKTY